MSDVLKLQPTHGKPVHPVQEGCDLCKFFDVVDDDCTTLEDCPDDGPVDGCHCLGCEAELRRANEVT